MNRPSSVNFGVGLILLGMIVALVSVSINIAYAPPEYSRPVMIGVSAFFICLNGVLVYFLYFGRNWARFLYAVNSVLAIGGGIGGPNPAGVHHEFVVVNHWFGLIVAVVVLVLLFLPSSNLWYKLQRANS